MIDKSLIILTKLGKSVWIEILRPSKNSYNPSPEIVKNKNWLAKFLGLRLKTKKAIENWRNADRKLIEWILKIKLMYLPELIN